MTRIPLTFSIVINTLNRAEHLRNCLHSLRYLRHPSFEVIVVNGPSTDNTEAVMAEYADSIRIGRCGEANLSQSRNVGIVLSQGEIVCFLDDDAQPEPDWLDQLELAYRDPEVGAVGGFIRDHSGVNFQCRITICNRYGDARSVERLEDVEPEVGGPGSWEFVSQTGCNSSFRRRALLDVGGFDEEFAYFLDETDVNLRLNDAGWKVTIVPEAEVHHKYAPSHLRDRKNVPKRLYLPLRSKAYFSIRHARSIKRLHDIMERLSAHAVEIHEHNRWYVDHDVIEQDHFEQLSEDVDTGLLDGVRDAMATVTPQLLDVPKATAPSREAFRRFVPLRPAHERLKLCFVTQDYPPGANGGIGVWTHHLATTLAARGHEVSVVTRSQDGVHTVDFEDGVWVHRIVVQWQPKRTSPPVGDLPQSIKDLTYCVHDEVMRIHLRRGLDLVSAPIWDLEGLASLAAGVLPVITTLHTSFQLALPHKPDWQKNKKYRREHVDRIIAAETELLSRAPRLMANSKSIVHDLEQANPGIDLQRRTTLVPHGIAKVDRRRAPRKRDGDTSIDMLFVGRFEERKGIDLLLEIAPDLLSRYPELRITLIGDDNVPSAAPGSQTFRTAFEARYKRKPWFDRIDFRGFVPSAELLDAYSRCDIFIAPSRYESFGLIYLEAMRWAKPCIGSNVGGIAEVVEHEVTGLLSEPGNADSVREAVERLLEAPKLREEMGKAGLDRFIANFTDELMAECAEQYYFSILEADGLKISGYRPSNDSYVHEKKSGVL